MRHQYVRSLVFVLACLFPNCLLGAPTISHQVAPAFAGSVEFELGGTTPGNGDGFHDQIISSGLVIVLPSATLTIKPWPVVGSFVPSVGDEFEILTWQTGIYDDAMLTSPGSFQNISVDPHFTSNGISFETVYTNVSGIGNLKLVAVPEANPVQIGVLCLASFCAIRFLRRMR